MPSIPIWAGAQKEHESGIGYCIKGEEVLKERWGCQKHPRSRLKAPPGQARDNLNIKKRKDDTSNFKEFWSSK